MLVHLEDFVLEICLIPLGTWEAHGIVQLGPFRRSFLYSGKHSLSSDHSLLYSALKFRVGTRWKDHSYHRFVIHYIPFSQMILISSGTRLAMVFLFDCNLRRCIATTHLPLRS